MKRFRVTDTLKAILKELQAQNHLKSELWDVTEIARYLKLAKSTVQSRILRHPDFPPALRLPTSEQGGGRRWLAKEVKRWAMKHREP